jgi:hypothetical protein
LGLRAILAALIVVNLEVIALRIEGRINIAEVNTLAANLAPQDIKVIAVVKLVHAGRVAQKHPRGKGVGV